MDKKSSIPYPSLKSSKTALFTAPVNFSPFSGDFIKEGIKMLYSGNMNGLFELKGDFTPQL